MNVSDLQPQLIKVGKQVLRHHVIIVVLALLATMLFTVFYINQIISSGTNEEYVAERQSKTVKTKFDEATIQRIDQLVDSGESYDLSLPPGRINPFAD